MLGGDRASLIVQSDGFGFETKHLIRPMLQHWGVRWKLKMLHSLCHDQVSIELCSCRLSRFSVRHVVFIMCRIDYWICVCVQLPRGTLRLPSRCLIWTATERWIWRSLNRLVRDQQHVSHPTVTHKHTQNQHIRGDRHTLLDCFNIYSSSWLHYSKQ